MLNATRHTALRRLLKNKTTVILNVAGLSIGTAICLLIAIWAEREVSFDNFHPDAENKYRLWNTFTSESESFSQAGSGVALGAQLPRHIPDIKSTCRVFHWNLKFSYEDKTYFEDQTLQADSNFFSFFGFTLLLGQPTKVLRYPGEVVMTQSTAVKYFGSMDRAVGKVVLMNGTPMTVSGIAADPPLNSHIQFEIVVPYAWLHAFAGKNWKEDLDNLWVGGWPHTYVQLQKSTNPEKTLKKINETVARFSKDKWAENNASYHYFIQPLQDIHLHSALRYDADNNGSIITVRVFVSTAIFILILACINYINLTTAASIQRGKEVSIRKVAGASRFQLIVQFFTETMFLSLFSVIIALVILKLSLPFFSGWMGQSYEPSFTFTNFYRICLFTLVITGLAGIYPAIILSSFKPAIALKGRSSGHNGQTARKSLVVVQFTIATVLLIAILVVQQQMKFIQQTPLGYDSDAVLTVQFNGDESVLKKYQSLRNELLSSPHIFAASRHSENIVGGLGNGSITTEDLNGKEITTSIYMLDVDAEYFSTYNMELVSGRTFTRGTSDSTDAVLVNEAAVKSLGWQTPLNAVGKPFGKGEQKKFVIGVIRDFHFESLHKRVEPVLIGHVRGGSTISLKVEKGQHRKAIKHLEQVWSTLVPDVPLQYSFVDDSLEKQYANEHKMESIFYVFAGLSLLIACMGLFGLSTFIIQQRFREIGIRKVLGAQVSSIVLLLTTDFSKLVLLSVVIATPIGWFAMQRWLESFAYHTGFEWWIFGIAVSMPLLIAVLTVSIQSIRTALTNPAQSLRVE